MVKQLLPAIGVIFLLSSCTVFKSLNLPGSKQSAIAVAPAPQTKFIEDITVTPQVDQSRNEVKPGPQVLVTGNTIKEDNAPLKEDNRHYADFYAARKNEAVSSVQLKYASLLNTNVESLPSKALLENVDDWYGVRYRTGGNTKSGVDCSGFTVAIYAAVYGIALPRVSRDQYRTSRKISTTELQEGDLVFFNTRGSGVSHVGIYLGNNRFIHASVSRGVMVSSLFEPYYLQRFVGGGRIDDKQIMASN
jgi:cell wall-associated NlpC family hydrolase